MAGRAPFRSRERQDEITSKPEAGYPVVDVWRVKPGREESIKPVLARARKQFSAHPDILSVDYCHVDGKPGRYLVEFRYSSESAREAFVHSEQLTSTMKTLSDYWELDDVYVKGPAAKLE